MVGVVLKKGETVIIEGQVPATVKIASTNGQSFVLQFEAVIAITGTDLVAAGMLLMAMHHDGRYKELATGAVIDLERQQ